MALIDKLTAIADAIRMKTGKTATMTLDEMPGEITSITTGGSGSSKFAEYLNKTITEVTEDDLIGVTSIAGDDDAHGGFYSMDTLIKAHLPDSVTYLGYCAFGYCTNLTEIIIPASVTRMGKSVFVRDTNLTSITFLGETPPTFNETFAARSTYADDLIIYVPANAISAYTPYFSSNSGWTVQAIPES